MRSISFVAFVLACGSRSQLDGAADASATVDAAIDASDVVVIPLNTPPSCQGVGPGLSLCGVDADSCCTTLDVPGGTFFRTYGTDGKGNPIDPTDPATVSGFRLDKYMVTVARFRLFAQAWANGWRPAAGSGKHTHLNQGAGLANVADGGGFEPGWNPNDGAYVAPTDANLTCSQFPTWSGSFDAKRESLPINCVNWYEAAAFCNWDGGFLPSDAEWIFAAAGGDEQRVWPWGNDYKPGSVSQAKWAIYDCNIGPGPSYNKCSGATSATDLVARVGLTVNGRAKWGHFDLAGDVSEWTIDSMAFYRPCTDCAYLTNDGAIRTRHGGDYVNPIALIHPWYRLWEDPKNRGSLMGAFRCARSPAN